VAAQDRLFCIDFYPLVKLRMHSHAGAWERGIAHKINNGEILLRTINNLAMDKPSLLLFIGITFIYGNRDFTRLRDRSLSRPHAPAWECIPYLPLPANLQ